MVGRGWASGQLISYVDGSALSLAEETLNEENTRSFCCQLTVIGEQIRAWKQEEPVIGRLH
jgi:hypothetical protein